MRSLVLCLLYLCTPEGVISQEVFPEIGRINLTLPGFIEVFEHPGWTDPTERYSILMSTFEVGSPADKDSSYVLEYVGKFLADLENFTPTLLYDDFSWPREMTQNPLDVFGFDSCTQADGFVVPGKDNGSVYILDVTDFDNAVTHDIVRDPFNPDPLLWFYHGVTWKDINMDGRLDAITCRVRTFGIPSQEETQMLWLEHPAGEPFSQVWTPHLINENVCGTYQQPWTFDIPGEGEVYALFTIGYFTNTFAVHWSTHPTGSWEDPSDIATRIIDTGHQFFDFDFVDVNKDGRLDILMTWNAAANGSFVAYEVPDDFRAGNYAIHVLADGFSTGLDPPAGTPGSGQAFYPDTDESGKPWLILCGDDNGMAYYLTPQSEDPLDWNYDLITHRDYGAGNIVVVSAIVDVDGDGNKELFIPVYYDNTIYVYQYNPS